VVTKADLEKLKIDIVNGLHKVGRKYACASLAEIEKTAVETSSKFKKTKSHSNVVKRLSERIRFLGKTVRTWGNDTD
jgi:hypothetical protein